MNKNKNLKGKKIKKFANGVTGSVVPGQTSSDTDLLNQIKQLQSLAAISGGITQGLGFAQSMLGNFGSPLFTTSLATRLTSGPLSYQKTDNVDSSTEMSNLNKSNTASTISSTTQGASLGMTIGGPIGAAVGGVAGLVGGLFGGASKRRKMRRMINERNLNINDANTFNQSTAVTSNLLNQYAQQYGDTSDDNLFNNGKSSMFPGVDAMTNNAQANALVGKGETIVDGNTGLLQEVTKGKAIGVDDVPANVQPEDSVAGNKINPYTGKTFAQDMAPLSRMEKKLSRNLDRNSDAIAKNTQMMVKRYTLPMAQLILAQLKLVVDSNGKAKYDNGKVADWLGTGLNTLSGLAPTLYNFMKGSLKPELVSPDLLYAGNPYAGSILSTMASKRYNVNPELDAINSLERRARYNTRQLGNESGINRSMDVLNNVNTLKALADALSRKQQADQSYKSDWANAAMQLGNQESQQRTAAMQSARDINARNMAAKNAFTSAGVEGLSNYMMGLLKTSKEDAMNTFQMGLMQKMYDLYHKDQLNKSVYTQPSTNTSTSYATSTPFSGFNGSGMLNYPQAKTNTFTSWPGSIPTNYNWSGMDLSQYTHYTPTVASTQQSVPSFTTNYSWPGMNLNQYR